MDRLRIKQCFSGSSYASTLYSAQNIAPFSLQVYAIFILTNSFYISSHNGQQHVPAEAIPISTLWSYSK